MQLVPTTLVRISRYYMLAAIFYLVVTLVVGVARALVPLPNPLLHWAPAVLGWISFPVMGAYYQFFPTLQGRDLHWEGLTLPQFGLMNAGLLGLMAGALTGNASLLAVAASVYAAGSLLFAAIIVFANLDRRQVGLTLRFYLASLAYFVAAVALFWASVVGIGPTWATRGLVLHVLVFGWAVMAIMGAEYSMVPMLQLKDLRHPRLASAQFYVVNAGFLGLALSLGSGQMPLIAASGTLVLAGIGVFAYVVFASLRHGPSRLPGLDLSVKYFVVGIVYLLLAAASGIAMAGFGWWALRPIHIHLGLVGAVSITIVGAMYHIVPFVVWWEVYAPRLGYEEVPLLRQLFNERAANRQLYGLNAGLLLMLAGFGLRNSALLAIGGSVLLVASLSFAWAMLGVVGHRRKLRNPIPGTEQENDYGAIA